MECIEEIINIHRLKECFAEIEKNGCLNAVLDEIVIQSKVEFNYDDEEEGEEDQFSILYIAFLFIYSKLTKLMSAGKQIDAGERKK